MNKTWRRRGRGVSMGDGRPAEFTHHRGCYRTHHACAIAVVDEQKAELTRLREEVERLTKERDEARDTRDEEATARFEAQQERDAALAQSLKANRERDEARANSTFQQFALEKKRRLKEQAEKRALADRVRELETMLATRCYKIGGITCDFKRRAEWCDVCALLKREVTP